MRESETALLQALEKRSNGVNEVRVPGREQYAGKPGYGEPLRTGMRSSQRFIHQYQTWPPVRDREGQRGRLAGIEVGELRRVERLWLDPDPPVPDRLGQLRGARQVPAGQNFVTDPSRDGNLAEETSKKMESLCRCEPDQRARVGYDEPFRHASTASASSRTVSAVPLTTGIPSRDT